MTVTGADRLKTRVLSLPLTLRFVAVEPSMVSGLVTTSSPVLSTITELGFNVKVIVLPGVAHASASRRLPAPLSTVEVTAVLHGVASGAGEAARASENMAPVHNSPSAIAHNRRARPCVAPAHACGIAASL